LSSQVLSTQVTSEVGISAWARLLQAHAALTRELSARLVSRHGLTLGDYDVLFQLYSAEGHRLRRIDLARRVLFTASGITRLLDRLERAGWVGKDSCASDARVTYAVLTESGLRLVEGSRAAHAADIDELFTSQFSPEECKALRDLLGRLPLAETACSE
jgi:DNA-binding MarR family transcriptional regulator